MRVLVRSVVIAVLLILVAIVHAQAAQGGSLVGTVLDLSTSTPVPNAIVVLEGTTGNRDTRTDADGKFSISDVAAGNYHLTVRANGYLQTRIEWTAGTATTPVEVRLNSQPHYSELVSVSPDARSQFDSYQPTSVLGGQDLAKQLQATIGATLANEPGVAMRAFGPGPARPVIRGLDGDRVLVLENGTRMGDLSSQSGDHGVNVNPAAASSIEVVRGPATLLYGANAIGGLVNVITKSIPTAAVSRPTGSLTFDMASAAGEAGGAGDITVGTGHVAAHFAASGRRAGDYRSPDGDIPNSFSRAGYVDGGLSYVSTNGYIGASLARDKTHYGIPFVEAGETNLDPRRTLFDLRAERRHLSGPFSSLRLSVGARRYKHDELDGEEVATSFENNTNEFELLAQHRPAGRLKGTLGVWGLTRAFTATGEEALSPAVGQKGFAAFLYEEGTLTPHVTVQFGGRVEHAAYTPAEEFSSRTFDNVSGSIGLLIHPSEQTTVAFSLARAARNPALEELYFHGPHPGNNAFENGDDALQSEHATGFDASVRWQGARAVGEVSFFANRISNFIFRQFTGDVDDDLPVTFFSQGNAQLTGIESHLDLHVAAPIWIEGGFDYLRGDLTSLDVPLPRMPPARGRIGIRFQHSALQAGIDGTFVAKQNRVFTTGARDEVLTESPTDGYSLAKLFAAYTFAGKGTTNTLAVRLANAGDRLYRNHLNYLKELAPEVGRDFRVTWTVQF